jgi:hypothetical protein
MKSTSSIPGIVVCLLAVAPMSAPALTRYVWTNAAASATPPYTNWATAAHTIQDAIAAAGAGDLILVTNGTYRDGGQIAPDGNCSNRVFADKAVTVRSVNGASNTVIEGAIDPTTMSGFGSLAVRCAWLTNGAWLVGFTLTNGHTAFGFFGASDGQGGGVWCAAGDTHVSNCVIVGNAAPVEGGGAFGGTLDGCRLSGNTARSDMMGGGLGGGACRSTLNRCTVSGNLASYEPVGGAGLGGCGGGVYEGTLNACIVSDNRASLGGAAGMGNTGGLGGGICGGSARACAFWGNSASVSGGGAYTGGLVNCTLTGNSATSSGGGASGGSLSNCIAYYNTSPAGPNYSAADVAYSCTTPDPGGFGNYTWEPKLASVSHLSSGSLCLGNGAAWVASGADIDGEAWNAAPAMGCDEIRAGSTTGALSVAMSATYTNVATGFAVEVVAFIEGRTTSSRWTFGDGAAVTNSPYISHAWSTGGTYAVALTAFNQTYPSGISATTLVTVVSNPVHYVKEVSAGAAPPFTSWTTAASNIQDAVDAASIGGVVLVSNGVYRRGGRAVQGGMTNRVAIAKPLTVRSVNGAEATAIEGQEAAGGGVGDGAVRCAYVGARAVLSGFTLTNGATLGVWSAAEGSGGGVWSESDGIVSNCVIVDNEASGSGGGAYGGTLRYCTIVSNRATEGGGVCGATLNASTVTLNRASSSGGGASDCTLSACLVRDNQAAFKGGGADRSVMNACTVSVNTAQWGGGGASCALTECMVWGNTASDGGGAYESSVWGGTLRGNSADNGGGAYNSVLTACTVSSNAAAGNGGGVYLGAATNCWLWDNTATNGGGACVALLDGCSVLRNSATKFGGGTYEGTLTNGCVVGDNTAVERGGGAYSGDLNDSTFTRNTAPMGGGCDSASLRLCTLSLNTASNGGGASFSVLTGCWITDNTATNGGGAYDSTATNCTFERNSAESGGGVHRFLVGSGYTGCTFSANSAVWGGGGYNATMIDCDILNNVALGGGRSDARRQHPSGQLPGVRQLHGRRVRRNGDQLCHIEQPRHGGRRHQALQLPGLRQQRGQLLRRSRERGAVQLHGGQQHSCPWKCWRGWSAQFDDAQLHRVLQPSA